MEPVPQSESEAPPKRCQRLWTSSFLLLSLAVMGAIGLFTARSSTVIHEERAKTATSATISEFRRGRLESKDIQARRDRLRHWARRKADSPTASDIWKTLQGKAHKFENKPRVRREWRSLNDTMKHKVAKAFWTVKTLLTEEGRQIYGENFNNHDDMLVLHSCATTDPRCDQGHFGPQFMTFHRALLLKYERSLLAVDPEIEAMPYWNMAFDAVGGKYRDDLTKYIFTDLYFGSYRGTGPNYEVIDGLFKYWPVVEWTRERFGNLSYLAPDNKCIREEYFKGTVPSVCDQCCNISCDCDAVPGATYTRRLRAHDDCSDYVARWPEDPDSLGPIGGTYEIVYNEADFDTCVDVTKVQTWMQWQDCIEMSTFICSQRFQYVSGQPGFQHTFKQKILPEMRKRVLASKDPFFAQALSALEDVAEQASDAFTEVIQKLTKDICGDYMLYGYLRNETTFLGKLIVNTIPRFFHSQAHIKFGKDLLDVTTSPNEAAAFTGYHSDIDRNSMTWMMNAKMANPLMDPEYWLYPVNQVITPDELLKDQPAEGLGRGISGPFAIYDVLACSNDTSFSEYSVAESPWLPGTLLDNVVNSGYRFKNLFDCAGAKNLPPGITCEYTYDTLEHYYYDVGPAI